VNLTEIFPPIRILVRIEHQKSLDVKNYSHYARKSSLSGVRERKLFEPQSK